MGWTKPTAGRYLIELLLVAAIGFASIIVPGNWLANAAEAPVSSAPSDREEAAGPAIAGPFAAGPERVQPAIDPYVQPTFLREMRGLRTEILAAAARHNRPELSGMSDREFAMVIAVLLYSERIGWLDAAVTSLRPLSPLYQNIQIQVNELGGANLSVWPANLRPSVALEILRDQVPVPPPTKVITVPLAVAGSQIDLDEYPSQAELYAALSREIAAPDLAVEYLAANLERGLYRADHEGVPVTWQTLAAWHNQGIVTPDDIRHNRTARGYIERTAAYLELARRLIDEPPRRCLDCGPR